MNDYSFQIDDMIKSDKTTLFVDFKHVASVSFMRWNISLVLDFKYILWCNQQDIELAEAIQIEFYRFEPHLRKALLNYVSIHHQEVVSLPDVLTG